MRSVTLNNNWVIQLTGANQRKVAKIVRKAAQIGGFKISDLRIGFTENGESLYWLLDDNFPALVLNKRVFDYDEDATRLLVALHELVHRRKVEEIGWENARSLAGSKRFEREIETAAYAILRNHFEDFGDPVPEETGKIHELFLRNLADAEND